MAYIQRYNDTNQTYIITDIITKNWNQGVIIIIASNTLVLLITKDIFELIA